MKLLQDQEFIFAIAFVIFVLTAWKPIGKMLGGTLDTRSKKLGGELDEALRLRDEAQRLVDEYRGKQEQAVKDAAEILAAARDEAERMRHEGEADLKRSLAAREAQAMDRIAQAEQAAVQAVRARAVDIAIRAAARLVPETLDAARANALVDQAIDDLPRRGGSSA